MHKVLLQAGLTPTDRHFADMLSRKSGVMDADLVLLFARLSQTLGNQNSCLRIDDSAMIERLRTQNCVTYWSQADIDYGNINTPLVLVCTIDGDNESALLYTNRFFQYESRIAENLTRRNRPAANPNQQYTALAPYFEDQDDPKQRVAAIQAVTRQLTIITGGPGTGKTSTVVKIVAGLLNYDPTLKIKLAAPTGKAAMRLSESIQSVALRLPDKVPTAIPTEVSTLHRLLGIRGDGQSFKYDRNNPLLADVLILDEASMIDLVMFDRILKALPESARLIILGDPYQLPSVDSGNVLADITIQGDCYTDEFRHDVKAFANIELAGKNSDHKLANAHCQLTTSYRFQDDMGIGQLAHELRQGRPLTLTNNDQVTFVPAFDGHALSTAMGALYGDYLRLCAQKSAPGTLIDEFDKARLLAPTREGEHGVHQLNATFEARYFPDTPTYYHGKPIMIMSNHYALRLFNGDIGICIKDRENVEKGEGSDRDKVEVAFKNPKGEIEYYLPTRLPQHSTCFAMTVHKSQGSEFDEVILVLPETAREDFITTELLYTGITRTRSKLTVFHTSETMKTEQQIRFSGLASRFLSGQTKPMVASSKHASEQEQQQQQQQQQPDQLDLF
jgi:exodeoxyribonuclease V alpha subunit